MMATPSSRRRRTCANKASTSAWSSAAVGSSKMTMLASSPIAKAIGEEASMVIFDEPTAALDQAEVEALFAQVRRLRDEGVAIIYISHRLTEVFGLVDRLVVLRDGVVALETTTDKSSEREVVAAMVGRAVENFYPKEH